jgi:2-methylisocitrate lyase-like PEP mutase family enzyme
VAAGFPVVATTSAGVAASLGYEDHEGAPAEEMLAAAKRIVASVDVPVTVDAEAGYAMAPSDVVEALFRAGAAGCNLEDSDHPAARLVEVDRQTDRLAAIREAAAVRGYGLVINARIDVFLADGGAQPQGALFDEAVARSRAYREAGVDCVFPILLFDAEVIASFVEAVQMPVNILALPQAPPIARLAEIGVARVSYGSTFHQRSIRELDASLRDISR